MIGKQLILWLPKEQMLKSTECLHIKIDKTSYSDSISSIIENEFQTNGEIFFDR